MFDFIKIFLWGILAILLSPLWIAALAIAAIVATAFFFLNFIKATFLFFRGKTIYEPLPEDIEAKKILNAEKMMRENALKNQMDPQPQQPRLSPLEQAIIDAGMAHFQRMSNANGETGALKNNQDTPRLGNKDGGYDD